MKLNSPQVNNSQLKIFSKCLMINHKKLLNNLSFKKKNTFSYSLYQTKHVSNQLMISQN